jgi:hypothetical protein
MLKQTRHIRSLYVSPGVIICKVSEFGYLSRPRPIIPPWPLSEFGNLLVFPNSDTSPNCNISHELIRRMENGGEWPTIHAFRGSLSANSSLLKTLVLGIAERRVRAKLLELVPSGIQVAIAAPRGPPGLGPARNEHFSVMTSGSNLVS